MTSLLSYVHPLNHDGRSPSKKILSKNTRFFISPEPAGRKITAGFSFIQRVGKSASIDVWFPKSMRASLDQIILQGQRLGPGHFPAEWAAIRQFELLQEAGNYKVYDLEATYLTRSMLDLSRNMRAGGYRVTIATIGCYEKNHSEDDLTILDNRLRDKISALTHMLYLEEESASVNREVQSKVSQELWDYRTALPHVGVTLGARDLFRPLQSRSQLSLSEQRHVLAQHFFEIVELLPQKHHIIHDTAIGLQLPDANAENENIYLALPEHTLRSFNQLLVDVFSPFDDKVNLSALNNREGITSEIKASVQHMRGYGDHLRPEHNEYLTGLISLTLQ